MFGYAIDIKFEIQFIFQIFLFSFIYVHIFH